MTTIKAIEERIRWKLKKRGENLGKPSTEKARMEFGNYFVFNVNNNLVAVDHCNLMDLARELGVLRPGEKVEEEK